MCFKLLLLVTTFTGTHEQIGCYNFIYVLGDNFKFSNNFSWTDSTLQNTVVGS